MIQESTEVYADENILWLKKKRLCRNHQETHLHSFE